MKLDAETFLVCHNKDISVNITQNGAINKVKLFTVTKTKFIHKC